MVYLADWRSAILQGKQLTTIEWIYNHFGPYVPDVVDTARRSHVFETVPESTPYGDQKEIIRVLEGASYDGLTDSDRAILDYVIEKTSPKNWSEFIRLVYSTYPIITQEKYTRLDLVQLADEYKLDQQAFDWASP